MDKEIEKEDLPEEEIETEEGVEEKREIPREEFLALLFSLQISLGEKLGELATEAQRMEAELEEIKAMREAIMTAEDEGLRVRYFLTEDGPYFDAYSKGPCGFQPNNKKEHVEGE